MSDHSYLTHLQCSNPGCGKTHSAGVEQHLCDCGSILLARYDLKRIRSEVPRERISARSWNEGLWRYAELHPVDGLISDAGAWVGAQIREHDWYDASTFKEPYRLEGKKTLGLEIAEQMGWQSPDVILYPTGGGVGLLGLWRAFGEMRALGW